MPELFSCYDLQKACFVDFTGTGSDGAVSYTHLDAYAASQVTDVPNTIPHPAQDSTMNLARSEKRWGTPQYSNGYICRNPERNNQMHHYDMNLCCLLYTSRCV